MSTTILFATDFSDSSEAARQITRALARHLGVRVACAHAAAVTIIPPDGHELTTVDYDSYHRMVQEELMARRTRLQEIAEGFAGDGIDASVRLDEGPVVDTICSAARDLGASLVILGSHGRTGLKRFFLGSVAERVVRACETSVLVARPPVVDRAGFHRVLVPTDFSQAAEVALDQAMTLTADNAIIDILHCWTPDEFPDGLLRPVERARAATTPAAERARELGEAWVRRVAMGRRQVAFHLVTDRPAPGIQQFVEEQAEPYDLVAVGTHGRTGMQRLLIGSVAESTVRYAPCSVLVARPRA